MFSMPQWRDALTRNSSARVDNKLECVSCMETHAKKKCIVAPCSHVYCFKCMVSLVETCLRDETIFPVKCCKQVIPTSHFIGTLNTNLRSKYELKSLELSTSADWRIYCSNKSCSAFLGSSRGETKTMTCSRCRKSTCSGCKQAPHPGDTCRGNSDALKVRQMARRERWQTCPGCDAIVEQNAGCNHMTCRCRTEFCYLCGVKWKTCNCPKFGNPVQTNQQAGDEDELDEGVDQAGRLPERDAYQDFFDGVDDDPWPVHYPDFDDIPRHTFDDSEDEGPYMNPYDPDFAQQDNDEDPFFDYHQLTQNLLDTFLPGSDDISDDDEGPYINPYDPESGSNLISYDASDEEGPHPSPTSSYSASDDEDVYINPYGSVPDLNRLHIDDTSDDEGPYINPYDDVPAPAPSRPVVTNYFDLLDDDDVYINPYKVEPKLKSSSVYYDSSDDEGPYINPYGSNSDVSFW